MQERVPVSKLISVLKRVKNRLFSKRLRDSQIENIKFVVPGYLAPGNDHLLDFAIKNLPTADDVVEIGSYRGL